MYINKRLNDVQFEKMSQSSALELPPINNGLAESVMLQFEPETKIDFETYELLSGSKPEAEIFESTCFHELTILGLSRDMIN